MIWSERRVIGVLAAMACWMLGPANQALALRPEPPVSAPRIADDSSDVAAVVTRYHAALASGDSATALSLLADDATILESGSLETRAEYRAHHLPADIAFARAVPSQRSAIAVRARGDVAWASSTSTTQGEFRGRPVNSSGAELMVLSRESDGWRIRAIHWSSRTRRAS
jgi:ketosteroid isomerase-like protein